MATGKGSKRSVPAHLPKPVVFGPSFPDFTMITKHGRQRFTSRTNQNLFLNEEDFNESGTFTMARLLRMTARADECWPLVWDAVYTDADTDTPNDSDRFIDWHEVLDEPAWGASDAFARLLGFCKWEPEKRFFREWARVQISRRVESAWYEYRDNVVGASPLPQRFGAVVDVFLDVMFGFPALIPETWLNYVGPEKTEADERHLAENPQRVDFAFFAEGRKCVIEIDGPSHYADFDGGSYTINEEKYAKNLAIERSLRRQGWEIYRFANVEVMRASGGEFARLIASAQLPGLACKVYPWLSDPYPSASPKDFERALDDLRF